jgi:hypothetical protein
MESPFKTINQVHKHLKQYWWHYTKENPYRVKELTAKVKPKYKLKYNPKDWNSDSGMVIINKVMK